MTDAHDQIGIDLAKHASERASKAMLDALSICDTSEQASMVAFHVLGIIAAQACGVITKHLSIDISELTSAEMLDIMADRMREVSGQAERPEKTLLREALATLEPFANHLDEMKFDTDNKGNLLPDDQTVGWVYVTNGDFRRARLLHDKIKKELPDAE